MLTSIIIEINFIYILECDWNHKNQIWNTCTYVVVERSFIKSKFSREKILLYDVAIYIFSNVEILFRKLPYYWENSEKFHVAQYKLVICKQFITEVFI